MTWPQGYAALRVSTSPRTRRLPLTAIQVWLTVEGGVPDPRQMCRNCELFALSAGIRVALH